jgi:cell division protein FtsB
MNKGFLSKIKTKIPRYRRIAFLLLVILFSLSLIRNVVRVFQARGKIGQAQERVEKLEEDNKRLQEQLEIAQSQGYIEQQLRDKLGLAKEGEIVIVLPDEEFLRKIAPSSIEEEETLPDPIWKSWLKLFF